MHCKLDLKSKPRRGRLIASLQFTHFNSLHTFLTLMGTRPIRLKLDSCYNALSCIHISYSQGSPMRPSIISKRLYNVLLHVGMTAILFHDIRRDRDVKHDLRNSKCPRKSLLLHHVPLILDSSSRVICSGEFSSRFT